MLAFIKTNYIAIIIAISIITASIGNMFYSRLEVRLKNIILGIAQFLDVKINSILTRFDVVFFISLFFISLSFPFGGFKTIVGDNICQVGHWHTLVHSELAGGIAASAAKPGLVLLYGVLFDISHALFNLQDLAFKLCLAFFFTLTLFMVGRIAADIGGKTAGVVAAFLVFSKYNLLYGLMRGSSHVINTGILFAAAWLFSKKKYFLSFLMLSVSTTMRIEVAGMSMVLLLVYLFKASNWKKFFLYSGISIVGIVVYFYGNFLIQGSVSRMDPLRVAGYIYPISKGVLFNFCYAFWYGFSLTPASLFLIIPAVFAIVSIKASRIYFAIGGLLIVILLYQVMFAGPISDRFIFPITALCVALGSGYCFKLQKTADANINVLKLIVLTVLTIFLISIGATALTYYLPGREYHVSFLRYLVLAIIPLPLLPLLMKSFRLDLLLLQLKRISVGAILLTSLLVFTMYSGLYYSKQLSYQRDDYITQGTNFIQDRPIPKGQKILSEDDILYVLATFDPDYYKGFFALQAFNVCDSNSRKGIIDKFDYIYFSKSAGHGYYYLSYLPVPTWNEDLFRKTVLSIIGSNQPREVYGHILTPIENSEARLILKIDTMTVPQVL